MAIKLKIILALLMLVVPVAAFADKAIVTHKISGCDYFVAYGTKGYFVLEWYGGHDPDKGDVIVGPINSYGFKDVYYPDIDTDGRVYVEDYYLSKEDAIEKMMDECS